MHTKGEGEPLLFTAIYQDLFEPTQMQLSSWNFLMPLENTGSSICHKALLQSLIVPLALKL